ncbi:hypothetical protein QOZ46_20305, partial [Pseudomonas aeruginosa]|uniref:hypothetical protein n=1 Tax=Pseudomonas aeruginosa TaxID=287 RepID=UPI003459F626
HWRPPLILNPSNHSKDDANVFTRSGPMDYAGDGISASNWEKAGGLGVKKCDAVPNDLQTNG